MFSKSITNSSQFLMMPSSSQNLYFHIGMNADDDGFCEHFAVMRMTDSKPDDLKILQAKNFVNVFDDRVLIILDWKENNYLRPDRYSPSKYLEVYKKEVKRLSSGIPKVDTGKDRLGKDSIGEDTNTAGPSPASKEPCFNPLGVEIIKALETVDPKNKGYYGNTTQRKACNFLLEEYGLEEVIKRISVLPKTNKVSFFPSIFTPVQLRDKWVALQDAVDRKRGEQTNKKPKVAFQ